VRKLTGLRLHTRAIICDRREAFVGSQSLRKIELDNRREVGIIASEPGVVKQIQSVFEQDWALTQTGQKAARRAEKGRKRARRSPDARSANDR
jgi:phosphatidylserine/phosphatidylglycerophosphate/cardiolipin synthase-like enzyme